MPLDLVDDARRDRREQLVRQARPVGRHAVAALDRADGDRVLVGPLVTHHADALHRQQHRERLPEPPVPARALHFFSDDRVGAAQQSRRSCVISPSTRTARPGPGNGWRQTNSSSSPSSQPDAPHLVLEQLPQRLDELEAHALRQPADVVMALDRRGRPDDRHALDDVGIERALRQEVEAAELGGLRPRRRR